MRRNFCLGAVQVTDGSGSGAACDGAKSSILEGLEAFYV